MNIYILNKLQAVFGSVLLLMTKISQIVHEKSQIF